MKRKLNLGPIAALGLFLGILALAVGAFVLSVFMVYWNVTDIQNNGLNIWNTFWLVLVGLFYLRLAQTTTR